MNIGTYFCSTAVFITLKVLYCHTLGLLDFTSRILATDLYQSHCNIKSHMKYSFLQPSSFLVISSQSRSTAISLSSRLTAHVELDSIQFSAPKLISWQAGVSIFDSVLLKVKVTLRLTVSQSVSLGVEPHLGLMTRYLILFDSYGLVSVGRLSNERTGLSFVYAQFFRVRVRVRVTLRLTVSQFFTALHGPRRKHRLSIVGKVSLQRRCIATEVNRLLLAYSLLLECVA
jgi:hypothetical protein